MMMNQIKQDKSSITNIANQVIIKRTVISDIANKMKKQAKAATIDRAAIAVLKKHISEEQTHRSVTNSDRSNRLSFHQNGS